MRKIESFKIGLNELRANKTRTSLTMLGIVFGVAAVIAMLSIGEGARQETIEQIELMGTNNIIVNKVVLEQQPKGSKTSFSPGLSLKDAAALKEVNPYIQYITPQRQVQHSIAYQSQMLETKIIGTTPDYLKTYNSRMYSGAFLNDFHMNSFSNVCVLGYGIKEKLFRFENPIGKKVKINSLWFEIIGVVAPKNVTSSGMNGFGLRDFNEDIYVPFSTMAYKMEKKAAQNGNIWYFPGDDDRPPATDKNLVDQLSVKVKDSEHNREAAVLIKRILERRHFGIKDYEVVLPEQLLEQKQKTQKIFNIVMGAIAGISLLVGGIGIMNIMLANILERTREIGVRRAMGATKQDLLNQFIYEALIISITGGLMGIILGFLLTSLITSYAEWRTIITPFSVVLAFFVSAAVGLIFGIFPAKQAADKDPIEALRYE
ncbi:MAG: ABC transporter permease [Ignavibacteriales bacterium]